jgi:hypothetical protein
MSEQEKFFDNERYVQSRQGTFEHFSPDFASKYAGKRTGYWRSEQWWERGTWRNDEAYGIMLAEGWTGRGR